LKQSPQFARTVGMEAEKSGGDLWQKNQTV